MSRPKLVFISLFVLFFIASCATTDMPKGSQHIGLYTGSFSGTETSGGGELNLYELPDGSMSFKGSIGGLSTDNVLFFQGKGSGNELSGEFSNATGTLSGTLSNDGQKISGKYDLINLNRNGNWEFTKK